jgi:crossover junction endodeoxyribonuclease RusA
MGFEVMFPPRDLHPNSRKDRRYTTKTRQAFKLHCAAQARHGGAMGTHLTLTFCPPDNRRRDLDNMFAAMKYGIDGIADAMNIDDSEFSYTIRKGEVRPPYGSVIIEVSEHEIGAKL